MHTLRIIYDLQDVTTKIVISKVLPVKDESPTFLLHHTHVVVLVNADWHAQNRHLVVGCLLGAEQAPVCDEEAKLRMTCRRRKEKNDHLGRDIPQICRIITLNIHRSVISL